MFQLPSSVPDQPLATTSKAPSMASASPAAIPLSQHMTSRHSVQPRQCPSSAVFVAPTSKMTSSAPAYAAPSTCLAPASLPAPLPQPPVLSWQVQCIQQLVPLEQLEEFLSRMLCRTKKVLTFDLGMLTFDLGTSPFCRNRQILLDQRST